MIQIVHRLIAIAGHPLHFVAFVASPSRCDSILALIVPFQIEES